MSTDPAHLAAQPPSASATSVRTIFRALGPSNEAALLMEHKMSHGCKRVGIGTAFRPALTWSAPSNEARQRREAAVESDLSRATTSNVGNV